MRKKLGDKIMPKKEGKYEEVFRDFCNSFDSRLEEKRGVAGDGKSPYHVMTCKLKRPSRIQISFDQTGNRKEINIHDFTKKFIPLFTISDDDLTHIVLEGEPTDRTFITRDFESPVPVTQSHQIIGKFDEVELRFHGGMYGRSYWIACKKLK